MGFIRKILSVRAKLNGLGKTLYVLALVIPTLIVVYMVSMVTVLTVYKFVGSEVSITANGWDRVLRGGESSYELYTDNGVFINEDTVFRFKYNSADIRATVMEGKSYTCSVQGFRFRFLSLFPNIIECKEEP